MKTWTHEHDGKTWTLRPLEVGDIIDLSERAYESERSQALKDMDDAGLEPEDRYTTLREFDNMRGRSTSLVTWAMRIEGTTEVLRCIVGDEVSEMGDPRELVLHALQCLGIDVESSMETYDEDEEEIVGDRPTNSPLPATG